MTATSPSDTPPHPRCTTDLDVTTDLLSATRARTLAPLTDAVRDASGAAGLGYLTALADAATAMVALCAVDPDWITTADLTLHESAPLVHGPTILEAELTRTGSRLVAVDVDVYDGDGVGDLTELADPIEQQLVATGRVTFARVPASTLPVRPFDPRSFIGGRRHQGPLDGLPQEPLFERCGLTVLDAPAGVVELPDSPYVRNRRGRISGGVLGMVFQAAAEAAAPGYVGSDIQVHYLAGGRVGPIRTVTRMVREAGDHVVCRMEAIDAGADDLVVAQATVTLQRYVG